MVITSEPKRNGTASIVATRIGLPTPEADDEARQPWSAVVERFRAGGRVRTPSA